MNKQDITKILASLRSGGIIAYPTESIWGLGCDPHNTEAVRQLLNMKKRSAEKGLILLAGDWKEFAPYFPQLTQEQINKIKEKGAHPCTWLVEDAEQAFPTIIKGIHCKNAIRICHHEPVKKLTSLYGKPIISTSANPSGQAPAFTIQQIAAYFGDQLDCILKAPLGGLKQASHIRDMETGKFLRH